MMKRRTQALKPSKSTELLSKPSAVTVPMVLKPPNSLSPGPVASRSVKSMALKPPSDATEVPVTASGMLSTGFKMTANRFKMTLMAVEEQRKIDLRQEFIKEHNQL